MKRTLLLLLLVALPAAGNLILKPGGHLVLAAAGHLHVAAANSSESGGGGDTWINAVMTSGTAPSPNVVDAAAGPIDPWKAFDHNTGVFTEKNNGSGFGDIRYDFGVGATSGTVNLIKIQCENGFGINAFTMKGGNIDGSYTLLLTNNAANNGTLQTFTPTATGSYRYYVLEWTSVYNVGWDTKIDEVELWGTRP